MASPDKSSMTSNLSQTHSAAPTHWNFTEVLKVPFFISQRPSGACLFNVVCDAAQGLREPIASCGTIKETQTFFFFFHFCFFVDWKEILKHCAMVPQKFWKVVRGLGQQSVWEPVGWRKGLHVASFQNGVLPDSTCEYPLPSRFLNFLKKNVLLRIRDQKSVSALGFPFFVVRLGWKLLSQLRGWRNHAVFQLKPLDTNSTGSLLYWIETWKWNSSRLLEFHNSSGIGKKRLKCVKRL